MLVVSAEFFLHKETIVRLHSDCAIMVDTERSQDGIIKTFKEFHSKDTVIVIESGKFDSIEGINSVS